MNYLRRLRNALLGTSGQQGILPIGYKLCEYLESTGTQYIDTGLIPTNKSKSIVDMQCTDWSTMRANFFGAGDYTRNARFNLGMNSGKSYFQWNIADYYFDNIRARTTDRVTITMDAINHSITFGTNTIIKDAPNYDLINNGTSTFWLFSASGAFKSYCKIFSCKMYDDNIVIRDFIPCLDNDNRPCMYDTVTKQTFYNAGTGEFLYELAKENLFDKNSIENVFDYRLSTQEGVPSIPQNGYFVSHYIAVAPNTEYILRRDFKQSLFGYNRWAFYNQERRWIANAPSDTESQVVNNIVVPENCYFIRFNGLTQDIDNITFKIF